MEFVQNKDIDEFEVECKEQLSKVEQKETMDAIRDFVASLAGPSS